MKFTGNIIIDTVLDKYNHDLWRFFRSFSLSSSVFILLRFNDRYPHNHYINMNLNSDLATAVFVHTVSTGKICNTL